MSVPRPVFRPNLTGTDVPCGGAGRRPSPCRQRSSCWPSSWVPAPWWKQRPSRETSCVPWPHACRARCRPRRHRGSPCRCGDGCVCGAVCHRPWNPRGNDGPYCDHHACGGRRACRHACGDDAHASLRRAKRPWYLPGCRGRCRDAGRSSKSRWARGSRGPVPC